MQSGKQAKLDQNKISLNL